MSAFSPDVLPPIAVDEPRTAARFLPTALRRVPSVAKPWSVPRLVVFGLLTAGFYPCHALQTRVRETLAMHAQQFDLAARWFGDRLSPDDAAELTMPAARLRPSKAGSIFGSLLLLASLICAVIQLTAHGVAGRSSWASLFVPQSPLMLVSVGLLSLSYLLTIVRMNRQIVAMQQFVLAFNAVRDDRTQPIDVPPMVWGARLPHVAAGVLMAAVGMVWALPMMLAWAALKDFSEHAVRGVRINLAERMAEASGVEPVVSPAALCTNPDCRLVSPAEAAYCPRCGRSTRPAA